MAEDADDLAAALLSEAGWVRRVAARLVRDGSAADDVAQDAWVQALKQRPDALELRLAVDIGKGADVQRPMKCGERHRPPRILDDP